LDNLKPEAENRGSGKQVLRKTGAPENRYSGKLKYFLLHMCHPLKYDMTILF
jgi:hypothetical protein